jgi:hypothetical protein
MKGVRTERVGDGIYRCGRFVIVRVDPTYWSVRRYGVEFYNEATLGAAYLWGRENQAMTHEGAPRASGQVVAEGVQSPEA